MQCSSWLLVQNIWQYWIYNKYTFQVHFPTAQMTQTVALTSVQETYASRFVIKINCFRLICQIVIAEVSWIQFIIIILFTRHFLFTYMFLSLPVTLLTNFVNFTCSFHIQHRSFFLINVLTFTITFTSQKEWCNSDILFYCMDWNMKS